MLPSSWVDRIFARLQGIYGTQFTGKFSTGPDRNGIDAGFENAKQVWADELAGFQDMPEAITYALRNLDDKFPPSAREFLALCRNAPRKETLKLEHKLTEEEQQRAAQAATMAAQAVKAMGNKDHLAWAKHPRSSIAFGAVRKLASVDSRFREILDGLIADGIAEEGRLLAAWDGKGWVHP